MSLIGKFSKTLPTLSIIMLTNFPLSTEAKEQSIKVSGECKRKVFPDEEIYQLSFVKSGKENKALQEEVSKKANKLIEELKKELEKKVELSTKGFQSYPEYQWIKGRNVFQGYQARYSLEIKLTDFNYRDKLQKITRSHAADEWFGPTHSLSESLKLKERDICLSEAMKDARNKALIIAKSAGVELLGLISASEIQAGFNYYSLSKSAGMAAMPGANMNESIAPIIEVKEMDYQMNLEATYSFK